jgi:hypothetical protein
MVTLERTNQLTTNVTRAMHRSEMSTGTVISSFMR